MAELIEVPAGLAGVVVGDTEVSDVLGDRGYYHYRGHSAPELARRRTFEEVAALVLGVDGSALNGDRSLPPSVETLVGQLDLRSALSASAAALDLQPLSQLDPADRLRDAIQLVQLMPTLVASVRHGRPVTPDPSLGHVADFLRMVTGEPAAPEVVAALEAYCVLTIDHGLSNSAFATRVVASSGADLGACVVAGFGSLSGPHHGANVERILDMFEAIAAAQSAEEWMKGEVAARRRLQGFGHAVYRRGDPRLTLLREHGAVVAPELHTIALDAEAAGLRLLAGRRLVPNLDLHAAVVLEGCGIPRGWFTAAFATARIVGWCAHALEQVADPKILRPAARYVGPAPDADVY